MVEVLTWKDAIMLGVALLGAALGIMNTWNTINQRRVRLRVTPAYAIGSAGGQIAFSIEVINLSAFSITVAEVGFYLAGSNQRAVITEPQLLDGKSWPRRLEPHEAVSAYFDPRSLGANVSNFTKAYARISSGEIWTGRSPALDQLREIAREVFGPK